MLALYINTPWWMPLENPGKARINGAAKPSNQQTAAVGQA